MTYFNIFEESFESLPSIANKYIVKNCHYKIRIAKGFEEVSNNKYPAFTNGRLKILRRFCLKLFPEHILYITRRCKKKRMPTICDIFRISRVGDIRKNFSIDCYVFF